MKDYTDEFIWTKLNKHSVLVFINWGTFLPFMLKPYFVAHPEVKLIIGDVLNLTGSVEHRFLTFEMANGVVVQKEAGAELNRNKQLVAKANQVYFNHPELRATSAMMDEELDKVLISE